MDDADLVLKLITIISEPEACSDLIPDLKPAGLEGLLLKTTEAAELLDELFTRAFREGMLTSCDELADRLERLSSALEAVHDALLLRVPTRSDVGQGRTAWGLLLNLASTVLTEVVEALSQYVGPAGLDEEALTMWTGYASRTLEGLRDLLQEARGLGASAPPQRALDIVLACLPDKAELASYIILLDVMPVIKNDEQLFPRVLAEFLLKGLVSTWTAHRGCLSYRDAAMWLAKVLKMEVPRQAVSQALRLLEEEGVLSLDAQRKLAIMRPREEDLAEVMRLARERYAVSRAGVNPRLLSECFGWREEYAVAVIEELVAKRMLFPGPSRPGVGRDYYPPPEG